MPVSNSFLNVFSDDNVGTAPLLGTEAPSQIYESRGGAAAMYTVDSVNIGTYGIRVPLGASINFTTHKYISFGLYKDINIYNMNTFADGGLRLYFFDSSGNYGGFTICGNDTELEYADDVSFSGWRNFAGVAQANGQGYEAIYEVGRAFDITSAIAPDMTDITHVELITNSRGSNRTIRLGVGSIAKCNEPLGTGGTLLEPLKFEDFYNCYKTGDFNRAFDRARLFTNVPQDFLGLGNPSKATQVAWAIGDGVTETHFTQTNMLLGIQPNINLKLGLYFVFCIDNGQSRTVTHNTSSTCVIKYINVDIGGKSYNYRTIGDSNGIVSHEDSVWRGFTSWIAGHDDYIQTVLRDGVGPVQITSDTTFQDSCIIQNVDNGLQINSPSGDYSHLDIIMRNNSAYDIQAGLGGPGNYNILGIKIGSGYTLKLHNNSTTNDIVITVPNGIVTSTSTAGGAIVVVNPAILYTIQLPNIIDGSRFQIYNVTTNTELTNTVTSGGLGINVANIKGVDYSSGDIGRYRVSYQSGVNAMQSIEGTFTFANDTTINSIPINQIAFAPYETFGVDGSTVVEFIWDGGNIEVDVNDPDNITNIQRFGAWYYYFITTSIGINDLFGGSEWESLNSIRINTSKVDVKIDNIKASPLILTGGRIYREDGLTIISDTSNSIQIDYNPVYTIEIGTSGLTPTESNILTNILSDTNVSIPNQISGLNNFNPTTDTVLNVLTVTNTLDMRGTNNALAAADYVAPDNTSVIAILSDTNELQNNQGQWVTATGFLTSSSMDALYTNLISQHTITQNNISAIDIPASLDATGVHSALDTYVNKDDFKASISGVQILVEELHKVRGLSSGSPTTFTPTAITTDGITLSISGDGINSSVVTRV
jgi:hypothetical protein